MLPDIIIQGTGVEDEHCFIDNIHGVITLHPVAKMCSVDGVFVTEPTKLAQGEQNGEIYFCICIMLLASVCLQQ